MAVVRFINGEEHGVHTIFCIGRNYVAHARELDNPVPDEPVTFIKPDTALIHDGDVIQLPRHSQDVHHELEMVVLLGSGGKDIPEQAALEHVAGVGLGIDVTARDIQNRARQLSYPWAVGKGFDTFAPVSDLLPLEELGNLQDLRFELRVNGELRQQGHTADMLFPVARIIAWLSTVFTLQAGDLVFTGTPGGVAAFESGDELEGRLLNTPVRLQVRARRG